MIFSYLLDQSLIFYGIIIGTTIILGYYIYNSIRYNSKSNNNFNYTKTGIVTRITIIPNGITTSEDVETNTSEDIETNTSEDVETNTSENIETNTSEDNSSEIITQNISESITTHESKINELCQIYSEELNNNALDIRDVIEIVNSFSIADLTSSEVHGLIISMIETIL
jgi:hypothetical protein